MAERGRAAGGWRRLTGTGEALAALVAAEWTVRRRSRGDAVSPRAAWRGGRDTGDAGDGRAPTGDDAGARRPPRGDDAGAGAGRAPAAEEPGSGGSREARRVARSVARACRLAPWDPTCLVRALTLERLLRRHGVETADVRVGVRRRGDGFAAHAWVEHRGEVLGDTPENVAEYRPLPGLDVFPE